MLLSEQKNSKMQGNAGIGSAINYFVKNGYIVSIPLTDTQEYDLVVEINNELKKVQVKTTFCLTKNGFYKADLRTSGGNRSRNYNILFNKVNIDYLFILTESNDAYFIDCKKVKGSSTITLGEDYKEFKIKV